MFDDVSRPVFLPIQQARQAGLGFAFHGPQRDYRLHPVTVRVATQSFSIVGSGDPLGTDHVFR